MRKVIVVDTETGGLDPSRHSILTFGACLYNDGVIESTFLGKICEPELCLDPRALKVNGIIAEDVLTWDSPQVVVQKFVNWLADTGTYGTQTMAAHGIQFDAPFIRRLWRLAGVPFEDQWSHRMICTQSVANVLIMAGQLELPNDSASLDNLAAYYGVKREHQYHDALEDAILTARVLRGLINRVKD